MNQMSGECRPSFTPKQGQYLAFIDAYTRVHRRPPAEREMQRHFGVTPPSVHQMVLNLERAGLIRRQPGVPRSIEVLVPPEDLPVLQHISSRSKPLCRGTSDGQRGASCSIRPLAILVRVSKRPKWCPGYHVGEIVLLKMANDRGRRLQAYVVFRTH